MEESCAEIDVDEVIDVEADELEEVKRKKARIELLPTARVVGIIRRNWRPYCGILMPSSIPGL